jgi:hypothetical protein
MQHSWQDEHGSVGCTALSLRLSHTNQNHSLTATNCENKHRSLRMTLVAKPVEINRRISRGTNRANELRHFFVGESLSATRRVGRIGRITRWDYIFAGRSTRLSLRRASANPQAATRTAHLLFPAEYLTSHSRALLERWRSMQHLPLRIPVKEFERVTTGEAWGANVGGMREG